MTIHLTPEQERRLRAVLRRGAYESVDEVGEGQLSIGIGAAENQATGTPDRKWKDCSTNCPELRQD